MSTSGREIGRRRGASDLDAAAHLALQQTRKLHMLPGVALHLEASSPPEGVSRCLKQLLDNTIFRYQMHVHANFEGMEHLHK